MSATINVRGPGGYLVEVPKRPDRNGDDIRKEVAKALFPKVAQWLKSAGDDVVEEEIIADLEKALKWGDKDGYELAKDLDGQSWTPDSELVNMLDEASGIRYSLHQKACEKWVIENNIQPPPFDAKAKCIRHMKVKGATGVITRIYPDGTATFTTEDRKSGGYIIPWEDLEILP